MKNFGIFFNPHYLDKGAIFKVLKVLHEEKDLNFFKFPEQSNILPEFIHTIKEKDQNKLDCLLSFGGDGTFLRTVKFSLKTKAPILGINLGKLGFLSESSVSELEKSIDDLIQNNYKVQKRLLLNASIKRDKEIIFSANALNDAVLYKGEIPKLIDIRFYANRRFVLETRCDGIIISTPTGSTAYSLSAGGPIISPVMDAFIVTPLNPHILSVRPMVFDADDKLNYKITETDGSSYLQLDGVNSHSLKPDDEVIVTSASQKVNFIKLTNKTFFQILRKKLKMGKK